MENEEEVIIDPINEGEVETPENPPEVPVEKPIESPEDKAARLLRQANQARKKLGLPPVGEVQVEVKPKEQQQPQISTFDVAALIKNNVAEEDFAEVEEYARFKKVSVAEALKSSVLKNILAEKEEFRATAKAANTKHTRGTSGEIDSTTLLNKAGKGELPEEKDIERLVAARLQKKKDGLPKR
jgi:hypothetical protein